MQQLLSVRRPRGIFFCETFEGWLRYQAIDAATTAPEELETWRHLFEEAKERTAASPKVGLMKLQPVPNEYRYAVAVREDSDLWLVLWVRRSWKGEFFVMMPRSDRDWDVHASYRLDGTFHMKSHGRRALSPKKLQPLTEAFKGTENLGAFGGYGPKSVGAICDPAAFSGIVEVPSGVLGPRHGQITVDLVQPGCDPMNFPWTRIAKREVFKNSKPWVVITVGSCD